MKLSLAITNFNRYDLLLKSFENVVDDNRLSEIILYDDGSDWDIQESLRDAVKMLPDKVKLFLGVKNVGMSRAKRNAISLCENRFAIILDSDNSISEKYIDAIADFYWDDGTIMMPEMASPNFDYRAFSGLTFDSRNVNEYLDKPLFEALLNTSNYVVPVVEYLKVYEEDKTVKESDTVHFAYHWLRNGYQFKVVEGLQYEHLVHPESGWLQNAAYNSARGKQTIEQIRAL